MQISTLAQLSFRASKRYFNQHRRQFVLGLLGVVIGVAAVVAVSAARQAVSVAFEQSLAQYDGGATHRISTLSGELDQARYFELRKRFGSVAMAPVIRFEARNALVNDIQVMGIDVIKESNFRSLAAEFGSGTQLDLAQWMDASQQLAVAGSSLATTVGEKINVQYAGQNIQLEVAAIADANRYPGTEKILLVDIALAQRWAQMEEKISYIDLQASQSQFELMTRHLPNDLNLRALNETESGLSDAFELNLMAMGLLSMLMGCLIIFSTFRFMLLQRKAIYGLRRLLGNSRGEIAVDVLLEALILGVVGSVLGIVLGFVLARFVTAWMQQTISSLYYDTGFVAVSLSPSMVFLGLLVGVGGCLAAATPTVWWASKVSPIARRQNTSRGHLWSHFGFGCVLFLAGLFLLLIDGPLLTALAGLFALALGYVWLGGPVLALIAKWIRRMVSWAALVPALSMRRLQATLDRTGPAMAALILAVATVAGVGTMVGSFRASVGDWLDASLSAPLYLNAQGKQIPDKLIDQISKLPEISDVGWMHLKRIQLNAQEAELAVIDLPSTARDSYPVLKGRNLWDSDTPNAVMVGETLATRQGLELNDQIDFELSGQQLTYTVVGIFQDYRAGLGRVLMDRSLWPGPSIKATSLALYLTPEAVEQQVVSELSLNREIPITVISAAEVKTQTLAIFDRTFLLTRSLRWIVALVALVGMTGALLALQLERRAELRLLHRVGVSPEERKKLTLWESGLLGLLCACLALPLGWLLAWALCEVINLRAFGWHVSPRFLVWDFGLALIIALLATLMAGYFAAQSEARQSHA